MRKFLLLLFLLPALPLFSQASAELQKKRLLGKLDFSKAEDFQLVNKPHATRPLYLHTEVYAAFIEMFDAAKEDKIELQIISGARTFEHQKAIWEKKWNQLNTLGPMERTQKILEFSAMPATSRHHWGTEVDLNGLENSYFEEGSGKMVYEWLLQNASRFGFYQVYDSRASGRTGYSEEKWHWSYLPLAKNYLSLYNELIDYSDITGFKGDYLARSGKMISQYVNGIAPVDARIARLEISMEQED